MITHNFKSRAESPEKYSYAKHIYRQQKKGFLKLISTWMLLSRFHPFGHHVQANHDAYHSSLMRKPKCRLEQHHPWSKHKFIQLQMKQNQNLLPNRVNIKMSAWY